MSKVFVGHLKSSVWFPLIVAPGCSAVSGSKPYPGGWKAEMESESGCNYQ